MRASLVLCAIAVSLCLGGCGSGRSGGGSASGYTPIPNKVGNHWYLAGDDACRKAREAGDGYLDCYDEQGRYSGRRAAMSPEEVYRWQTAPQRAEARRREKLALWQAYSQELHNLEMERQMRRMNNQLGVINSNIVNRRPAY